MARLPRMVLPGVPLHVVQRGNNRQAVFFSAEDYAFYLDCLEQSALDSGCSIHAYVLMTNHVHLLLTPADEGGPALMMQALGRRYVRHVNRTYGRTGTLWEGRFKSALVETEDYLLGCMRYIELNPVRAGMVGNPSEYPWSSYMANAHGRRRSVLVAHEVYCRLGRTVSARQAAYRALLGNQQGPGIDNRIREATERGEVAGEDDFQQHIECRFGRRVKKHGHGGDRKSESFRKPCLSSDLTP